MNPDSAGVIPKFFESRLAGKKINKNSAAHGKAVFLCLMTSGDYRMPRVCNTRALAGGLWLKC